MELLPNRDLRMLLRCLRQLYAHRDLEIFPLHSLSALAQVIPWELAAYSKHNLARQTTTAVMEPSEARFPGDEETFSQHISEHPLITYHQRTRDGRASKISDFLTQRQFHRLGLYQEYYRRVEVEYQMAIALPSSPSLATGVTLNRSRGDFSERERLQFNLLRPHLIQAYRNAEAVTQLQQDLSHFRQALEVWDRGMILLQGDGRVRLMTERAQQWVKEYFGKFPRQAWRLPEELWQWVQSQHSLWAQESEIFLPRAPLIVERGDKQLVVRLVPEQTANQLLLLLEEQQSTFSAAALESLNLSRREAEVLFWVAQGKKDPEVALMLGISVRTVHKHLEHIYQRLGVETRTAATRHALDTLGLLKP